MNQFKENFFLQDGITYLNHGSFGACPKMIFDNYQDWQLKLEKQPVKFFSDEVYNALEHSRIALSQFLGCDQDEILFFQNPTTAISNIIYNLNLKSGDEILMTDHEYGALVRAWNVWGKKNNIHIKTAKIAIPLCSDDEFVGDFCSQISPKTKVIFLSQITSPTGLILPINKIIEFAKEKNILTIVDGAHVPGHINLNIHDLGCDFYTGALHKWMCGPKGASFLFVKKKHQHWIKPLIYSWGKNGDDPGPSEFLQDFQWQGTRDMSAFLTIPKILDFFKNTLKDSQTKSKKLIQISHQKFKDILGTDSISNGKQFIGHMVSHPLPKNTNQDIKNILWNNYCIEIPIFKWEDLRLIRLSIHIYNDQNDIDSLMGALKSII